MHPGEQVVTGEAVALDLRTAGVGSRGIAALIDIAIITTGQVVLLVIILAANVSNAAVLATAVVVTEVLVVLGYPVAMETLWRGRTVGKATMGLRVVRDDGGPIRFRHAFVRGLVGVVLDKPGLTFALAALIPMVATARTKRLGDIAAGTLVLQDRVPGRVDAPLAMPPALAGWAAGLDLTGVDDAMALRLRQFVTRAAQLEPAARDRLEHEIVSDVAARVGAPPPYAPGWAVITAVLAERRRRAFAATQPAAPLPPWEHQPTVSVDPAPPALPPTSGFRPPS